MKPEQYQDVFKRLAGALQDHLELNAQVDEAKVREIAQETVSAARLPRPLAVTINDGPAVQLEGRQHCQFTELVKYVEEGHRNILMVGPAGSGKTTLAKDLAKALDRDFAFISLSAGVTETHLFGRMLPQADGTFAYVESPFVRIYRTGGVYLFDELDAADSNVMVSVNAALANGVLCNPVTGEIIHRHEKCLILAAANTFGRGGDHMYVGRNALDAATLDRFVLCTLNIGYDTDLEMDLARSILEQVQADELVAWVNALREKITDNRLRRIASTRLVVNSAAAMKWGANLADVKRRFHQDWSRDELAKIAGV
jgi:cobaltochelatase CobS